MEIICYPNVAKQIIQQASVLELMTSFENFDNQIVFVKCILN